MNGTDRQPAGHEARHVGDVYFSADLETDGTIPPELDSMVLFALVCAGRFDVVRS